MPLPSFASGFLVVTLVYGVGAASAQTYPNKPVRIVTSEAGGGTDFVARIIAQGLTGSLGQQVIIDNRGGVIPAEIVAKAPADGYTLVIYGGIFWSVPLLQRVSFDLVKDFSPITLAASSPNLLTVHPTVPAKSVKELIALARAKPGQLNYSSGSNGATNHIAGELFKSMAGVDIVRVPYKGTGPALNALLGGQVQLMFTNASVGLTHVKSGRLTALAITSPQPSALAPELPTVASGLPGYEAVSPSSVYAPARTPDAIVRRLNQEIVRVLNRADSREKLFNAGLEVVASSPDKLAAAMQSEVARVGKVIKDSGIRAE